MQSRPSHFEAAAARPGAGVGAARKSSKVKVDRRPG